MGPKSKDRCPSKREVRQTREKRDTAEEAGQDGGGRGWSGGPGAARGRKDPVCNLVGAQPRCHLNVRLCPPELGENTFPGS